MHNEVIPHQWQSVVEELRVALAKVKALEGVRDGLLRVVEDMRQELADVYASERRLRAENQRLRERSPMTMQEMLERADAAERGPGC